MTLNGCCECVKYFMIVLNSLFWVIGLSFIICSIWMLTDPTFLLSMTQPTNDYYITLYIFLAVGFFIVIGAFLGCCGSYKESQCLLVSFFCILLVVLVAQIAAGAWAFHNKDKLEETVRNSVKHSVQEEYGQAHTHHTITFDSFQKNLQCCGANGPMDWAASKLNSVYRTNVVNMAVSNTNSIYEIPSSCCKNPDPESCDKARQMKVGDVINSGIYETGCIDKVVILLHEHWKIILAVTIIIICFELLALILALSMCCVIKKDHYKG